MNEKLIELLEEVKKNEELQTKMEKAQSIDELYAVTTQYVDGYSLDELKEGLKFIKSQTSDELSDEDLEMVAGGSINNKQPNQPNFPDFPQHWIPVDLPTDLFRIM